MMIDTKLPPSVFFDKTTGILTTKRDELNLILLNLLGEINSIFLDIKTGLFVTKKREDKTPYYYLSLHNTLKTKEWFKALDSFSSNGYKKDDAKEVIDNASDKTDKLFNFEVVTYENLNMNSENFFKLIE